MAMRGTPAEPEGLRYVGGFLSAEEAADALAVVEALDFVPVVMRGQAAKRTVRFFGRDYDYDARELQPGEPLPSSLTWLRDRCAALIDRPGEELAQILISRYPEGAGIGWHRDAPMFGPEIVGVSLAAPCPMQFERKLGGERHVHEVTLEPGSAYVLGGLARSAWRHSIPAVPALRYSLTFRTLRGA